MVTTSIYPLRGWIQEAYCPNSSNTIAEERKGEERKRRGKEKINKSKDRVIGIWLFLIPRS